MTAKEWLRQARIIEMSIMATEARMIKYTRAAEGAPPHSRAVKAYSGMVADMSRQVVRLRDWMRETERMLEELPDERYSYILRRRYMDGVPLKRIARDMHYSYDRVLYLHAQAIKALEKHQRNKTKK